MFRRNVITYEKHPKSFETFLLREAVLYIGT